MTRVERDQIHEEWRIRICDQEEAERKKHRLNEDAILAREERWHLEMMAATITSTLVVETSVEGEMCTHRIPDPNLIALIMSKAIEAARQIRDEQNRAGTEGKADE